MNTPVVASPVTALIDIIDGQRWDDLKSVLAPDCVMERPGSQPMAGLDRIEHFYRNERQVRHGKHVVDRVVADEEAAACWGTFRGETPDGSVIEARFADTFVLADGLIRRRTTYVHAPGH
ncbi:nuclear transport factor 2 family protein [Streptomyces sp. NPDC047869]|uniref:nuclear transport factor 2 family protein n=1 Tax=Streptomyces sp. NPDC047869 TaxID=3154709 RepID=UPI003455C9A0